MGPGPFLETQTAGTQSSCSSVLLVCEVFLFLSGLYTFFSLSFPFQKAVFIMPNSKIHLPVSDGRKNTIQSRAFSRPASKDVPSLRLGLLSPRSSSSDVTSRRTALCSVGSGGRSLVRDPQRWQTSDPSCDVEVQGSEQHRKSKTRNTRNHL